MATETEVFKLDLDASSFLSEAKNALEAVEKIGETKSLGTLVSTLKEVGTGLAVVGVALGAFKLALDIVEEAENIERINNQFNLLAQNAGLAGDTIKEKLVNAAGGLADDTKIIEGANRAIIAMGENAIKLPEIMELARKATAVMGGDVVQNFENISMAVATGNTRLLKHMGIVVDLQKAQRDYALAHGITISQLDEEQKKQAVLDAVLAKRESAFKGVESAAGTVTLSIKKIGVEVQQSMEIITKYVGKIIGPTFQSIFSKVKEYATDARLFLEDKLGSGASQATAHLERLSKKQEDLKSQIAELQAQQNEFGRGDPYQAEQRAAKIARLKDELEKLGPVLATAKEQKDKFESEAPAVSGGPSQEALANEALQNAAQKQELAIKTAQVQQELSMNEVESAKASADQKVAIEEHLQTQLQLLRSQAAAGQIVNLNEQEVLLRAQAAEQIQKINENQYKNQESALQRQQQANQTFYSGWKNQSAQAAVALQKDQMTWAKAGAAANDTLTKTMAAGFINISKGSKEALKAMKTQFFGLIADKAQAEGMLHLAAGILNPAEFGVGAALLALSGVIRGIAGGDLGSASGGASASGGGALSADNLAPPTTPPAELPAEAGKPQKTVTIAVQGNYFETESTRRALLEMIRSETDATSFQYVQIPQSGGA
jgi:hypothetical protein